MFRCHTPVQQFWIPASKALAVVAKESGDYPAILAICQRAHEGMLLSKADLYVAPGQRSSHFPIPSEFWWAEGHEALEQDWARGDFSTWIDRKYQRKAFGVSFDFEGLRSMLPVEAAAAALRELSVSSDAAWLSAREARRFMYERVGMNPIVSGAHILELCRLGFLPGRAQLYQRSNSGTPDRWSVEEREWDIPPWFWTEFTRDGASSQDWDKGQFNGKGRAPDGRCWIRLSGVHFLRAPLDAMLAPSERPPEQASQSYKGGRPRKEWWDDLWCGVWGQIVHGEFTPKTQADVERAMLDWVSERGESVAESTIRPMARKLFVEWEREAKN